VIKMRGSAGSRASLFLAFPLLQNSYSRPPDPHPVFVCLSWGTFTRGSPQAGSISSGFSALLHPPPPFSHTPPLKSLVRCPVRPQSTFFSCFSVPGAGFFFYCSFSTHFHRYLSPRLGRTTFMCSFRLPVPIRLFSFPNFFLTCEA